MKKYRFASLLLALVLLAGLFAPAAQAAQAPDVTAGAALLMDARYDEVLYEKNAHDKMYPASLTKVMTALLVLEAVDAGQLTLDQVVTVSSSAVSTGLTANGSTQNIKAGEQLSVLDLLYCLLVASANEASNILAEAVSGDISLFVQRMNERAQELGCEGTHFVNPHGLHDDDHYITACDMYLIARAAMEHDTFRTIVSSASHTVAATNLHDARTFYNTNALLVTWYYRESYIYDKAIGIKTGTTDEGGYCLLSAAEDGEDYLICVVLKASLVQVDSAVDRRQFTESRELLKWGFSNFKRRAIVDTQTPLAQVGVTLSDTDHVLVRPASQLERTLANDVDLTAIEQEVQLFSDTVQAPVTAGQTLGTLVLSYQGKELGRVDLVSVSDAERSELLYRLDQIKNAFRTPVMKLAAVVVILLLAVLILRSTVLRPRSRYGSRYSGRRRNYTGRRRR